MAVRQDVVNALVDVDVSLMLLSMLILSGLKERLDVVLEEFGLDSVDDIEQIVSVERGLQLALRVFQIWEIVLQNWIIGTIKQQCLDRKFRQSWHMNNFDF